MLRSRVFVEDNNLLIYREVPSTTAAQLDVLFDKVDELVEQHRCRYVIIDLNEASGRPDAALRERLRQRMLRHRDIFAHVAICLGRNIVIRIATKFAMAGVFNSYSVHGSLDGARAAIEDASNQG